MIDIFITTKSPYKTIKYLNKMNINIYNIKYNKKGITIKISSKDLPKIKKYYNYNITKHYGKKELINYLKQNIITTIYFISIIILISLITRVTLNVEVISENTKLRKHILK